MRTVITLVVDHDKHINDLHTLIANRSYSIDGVNNVEVQVCYLMTDKVPPCQGIALPACPDLSRWLEVL